MGANSVLSVLDGVLRHRRHVRRSVQKLRQIAALRRAGAGFQEVGGGLHRADLLRNRRDDPLIERYTVLLRQPRRRLLERLRQLQGVFVALGLRHVFSLLTISPGVATVTPSVEAGRKSLTLCVTMASACPFSAASSTISSAASDKMGRVLNEISTPSDTAASALISSATSSRLWPVAFRVSSRLNTASYSRNSAVEQSGVTRPRSTKRRSRLLAPLRLRKAATMTLVSRTSLMVVIIETSHKMSIL